MSTAISRPDLLTFLTLLNVHLPTGVNMPFSRVQADVRPKKELYFQLLWYFSWADV